MNYSSEFSGRKSQRLASLFLFVAIAIVGPLVFHYVLFPFPVQIGAAPLIVAYAYFLAWLGGLIHLLGKVVFGHRSKNWHVVVFFLLGGLLGSYGGLFFAGYLGFAVGGISGVIGGPAIFLIRGSQNKNA